MFGSMVQVWLEVTLQLILFGTILGVLAYLCFRIWRGDYSKTVQVGCGWVRLDTVG